MNITKLMELERSIELNREYLNTAQSTIASEIKLVIDASLLQSKEINAMQSEM
jgi:hypothetical protein